MSEQVINCPICGGATSLEEQKKSLFRPQRLFHQCQNQACVTRIIIDDSRYAIDDTIDKQSSIWNEFKKIRLSAEGINSLAKRAKVTPEEDKNRCGWCLHRKVGSVCGNADGPFSGIKIEQKNHFCDFFKESEPTRLYLNALLDVGDEGRKAEVIGKLEAALEGGIPEDDQVDARAMLGNYYLTVKNYVPGFQQLDKSLELDSKYDVGFYADKKNREVYFWNYEIYATIMSDEIKENKGVDEALGFLEDRLRKVDYLSGNILFKKHFFPAIYHAIAGLMLEKEDTKSAMKAFEKCEKAEHYEGNKVQDHARENAHDILMQYEMDKIREKQARRG